MRKYTLAALLWLYAVWYAGATLAAVMGLSTSVGPILGLAAGAYMAAIPLLRWVRTPRTSSREPVRSTQSIQRPV